MSKSLKRLELRLPVDHPLWDYPPGWRTKVARQWLDLGQRMGEIEETLSRIETLVAGPTTSGPVPSAGESDGNGKILIDRDEFLGAFG